MTHVGQKGTLGTVGLLRLLQCKGEVARLFFGLLGLPVLSYILYET